MRLVKLLFSSCLIFFLTACTSPAKENLKVILDSIIPLDSLSSGSGIVYANSHYYIIGDDSPWLYRVTETMKSSEWVKLSEIDSAVGGRTPKALKADFECMESMMENSWQICYWKMVKF